MPLPVWDSVSRLKIANFAARVSRIRQILEHSVRPVHEFPQKQIPNKCLEDQIYSRAYGKCSKRGEYAELVDESLSRRAVHYRCNEHAEKSTIAVS